MRRGRENRTVGVWAVSLAWLWVAGASSGGQTIRITTVADGYVHGTVEGVDFASHRAAPYIQVEGLGWWSKPTSANPTVPINASGYFVADYTTGGLDSLSTVICAALVDSEVPPPLALGYHRIPASLESVDIDCRELYTPDLEFADRHWSVKEATLPAGPGGNRFSRRTEDVFVDELGLHLTVNSHDGYWWSTEVILPEHLGYGTYMFQTKSRNDVLDPNVTFGAFLWDPYGDESGGASPNREVDFEDSRWGVPSDLMNAQMVVQPFSVSGNLRRYAIPNLSEESELTRFFIWEPGQIEFVALKGHYSPYDFPAEAVIDRHVYTQNESLGHFVPSEGREQFRFNLWVNNDEPVSAEPIEVLITEFRYYPLAFAGDLDLDGDVDFDDIDDFVLGLTDPVGYEDSHGVPASEAGDTDEDGDLDFDDIDEFAALLGVSPPTERIETVPEPSAVTLGAVSLLFFLVACHRLAVLPCSQPGRP